MCTYARAHITHTFIRVLQDWKDAFPALPVPVALQIYAGLASHFGKTQCARDADRYAQRQRQKDWKTNAVRNSCLDCV